MKQEKKKKKIKLWCPRNQRWGREKQTSKASKLIIWWLRIDASPFSLLLPWSRSQGLSLLASNISQTSLHITTKHIFLGNLPQCISLILRRSYHESRNQFLGLAFEVTVNVNSVPLQLIFCSLQFKLSTSDRPCVLQALLFLVLSLNRGCYFPLNDFSWDSSLFYTNLSKCTSSCFFQRALPSLWYSFRVLRIMQFS